MILKKFFTFMSFFILISFLFLINGKQISHAATTCPFSCSYYCGAGCTGLACGNTCPGTTCGTSVDCSSCSCPTTTTKPTTTTTKASCGCCQRYVAATNSCVGTCIVGQVCYNCSCCTPATFTCGSTVCGQLYNGCGGYVNCPACTTTTTKPYTPTTTTKPYTPTTTTSGGSIPTTTTSTTTTSTTTTTVPWGGGCPTCADYYPACGSIGTMCGTINCPCDTTTTTVPTTTVPSTPTTTVPSTPTTTVPSGSQWYNCNGGRCWGPHPPPGTDECGGNDGACEQPPSTVPPEPIVYGIKGTVYMDLDGDGNFDTDESGFIASIIPDEYIVCLSYPYASVNCENDADCSSGLKCVPGTFCCRSDMSRCDHENDTDGYVKIDNCTSCSSTYSCQETSVCCRPAMEKVTIRFISGIYDVTTVANDYGVYTRSLGEVKRLFNVSIDSLPSGRYIVTSDNPVENVYSSSSYTIVNFGIKKIPANMNITGYVFNDFKKNGVKDGDDTCYNGTVSVTCCGSTNEFIVSDCEPQTWCNCSDSNTIVTLSTADGSTIRWSGIDSDGNPIGGEETNNSAYISIPE